MSMFIFFYLFLLLKSTEEGKVTNYESRNSPNDQQLVEEHIQSSKDVPPIFHGPKIDLLERELEEAIQDKESILAHPTFDFLGSQLRNVPPIFSSPTDDLFEQELEEASKDDAFVPTSLDNSLLKESSVISDDFENVDISPSSSSSDDDPRLNVLSLNKVSLGHVPSGVIKQNYSFSDQLKLLHLYQSNRFEDRKELFQFLVEHIHHKYRNCLTNFGQWLQHRQMDEPIFYRNCVPCTNAVDLNLQSLFNSFNHSDQLEHYFVNTCDMTKQWISYINDMEYLSDYSSTEGRQRRRTFTDVIRDNLLPNRRYVFQGIVQSNRGYYQQEFVHVCNLILDENNHLWIIDGQIQRVFDFNEEHDIHELNQRYRSDYLARAYTGLFRPLALIQHFDKSKE